MAKNNVFQMPQVRVDYYALKGGLDLVTPSISVSPGTALDAMNYEPYIAGGYRRINGYERFDGRQSPTSASYWVLPFTQTGLIAVGNVIVGATSGATGIVLGIFSAYLVLGRVVGTFMAAGEQIQVTQ